MALGLLAARPAAAQTEVIEYYGHDALGSIRIVFSASGVATARADYEPFGEAVTIAGMPTGPLPAQQFTGQERDALESQDYFGARYYRPRHGRFSQVDPVYAGLFDPQQWNRYAYARNNPLSFVDPDGRQVKTFRFAMSCPPDCTIIGGPLTPPTPPARPSLPPVFGVGPSVGSLLGPRSTDGGRGHGEGPRPNSTEQTGDTDADGSGGDQGDDSADGGDSGNSHQINQQAEDVAIVVPGVIGWKTGIPELHTSQMAMERAGTVMTASVVFGYGAAALANPNVIRFGPTVVSNQLVQGPGVPGAIVTWAIKGGGPGSFLGRLGIHYHIHRYNWYNPRLWFKTTPIIKPPRIPR